MEKYESEDTSLELHIVTTKIGSYISGNVNTGRYKSVNTNRKIQVGKVQTGRTIGKVQVGEIYDIATLLIRIRGGGGGY